MKYLYKILFVILVLLYTNGYAQYYYCHNGEGNETNPCGAPSGNSSISGNAWTKSELKYFFSGSHEPFRD